MINKNHTEQREVLIERIQYMRQKYNDLLNDGSDSKQIQKRELTEEQEKKVNTVIAFIGEVVGLMKEKPKTQTNIASRLINEQLNSISSYPLSTDQLEKIYNLLKTEERLKQIRLKVAKKLVNSINIDVSQTNEIAKLENFKTKINSEFIKENPEISSLMTFCTEQIDNKILKIKTNQKIQNLRTDVPKSIEQITSGLANGTLDIQKASQIIESEAAKRLEDAPKTKFALTLQQQKNQIAMQIIMGLREKGSQFCIKNPKTTVKQIQELFEYDSISSVGVVIDNLISRKEYEQASTICEKLVATRRSNIDDITEKEHQMLRTINDLRVKVKKAKITNMAQRLFEGKEITLEDIRNFEIIQNAIKSNEIEPSLILLGKSQNGQKRVTLKDVWSEKIKTERIK